MSRTVAIVQARMGSTRFPGKALADLGGKTVLARVLDRVSAARHVDHVVVATTTKPEDDPVVAAAIDAGFSVHRGSVDDVLMRYVNAAREHAAQIVIRNTADEPFLDPALIDQAWQTFSDADPPVDYVSNNLLHLYPEGIDTEVVSMRAMEVAHAEATLPSDREHVTPFLWRQPERFRLLAVSATPLRPDLRLTIDYPQDLEFARAVYEELGETMDLVSLITLLESRPELQKLCPKVPRREGYDASVRKDESVRKDGSVGKDAP